MRIGEVVGGRFVLEAPAGAGGMGVVFRARDTESGRTVAVKILRQREGDGGRQDAPENRGASRLGFEGRVLAELAHPAIVGHVAQGITVEGLPFVAMEWLEGEDLAARLARGCLPPRDAAALGARIAGALAIAHERGVLHRDLKPANVWLVAGSLDEPKILDFGIATALGARATSAATAGTPAYMAPEQARGEPTLDARADLYALGVLMFECVTGERPFDGPTPLAVLARVVFDDAPPLAAAGVTPPFAALVAALLDKDAARRPASALAVGGDLERIARGEDPERTWTAAAAVGRSENLLVSVVVARPAGGDAGVAAAAAELAAVHELSLARLLDGSLVATARREDGGSADLCGRMARYALALADTSRRAALAMATGRADSAGVLSLGDLVDRALPLGTREDGRVRVDATTAEVLSASFRVEDDGSGPALVGTRDTVDEPRRLLGRPTPLVGRDGELSGLRATFDDCVAATTSRSVLVTGPAGVGKSRLLHELCRELRGRADVWVARGDPMRSGAPFGLLGQLVRRAAGIGADDAPARARTLLRLHVARRMKADDAARAFEFLAEAAGLPGDAPGPLLRAAREQPQLMADQVGHAFADLVAAHCAARAVVVVLDDIHWGDPPTAAAVGWALRSPDAAPLLVVGLGRDDEPERLAPFEALRGQAALALSALAPAAADELARAVLGGGVDDATVRGIVAQAAGNALYLEELVRAVAAGRRDMPESVLAMVQARLSSLDEPSRTLLRAASIFGSELRAEAAAALVDDDVAVVLERARALVAAELLRRVGGGAEHAFAFVNALIRDAAYGMLTQGDRARGHARAAQWLETTGERDAALLAEHYERGGDDKAAARHWVAAAEQALEANDMAAVLARVARAEALGSRGEARARLALAAATAHHWRADYEPGVERGTAAMKALPPLTAPWYRAAEEIAECALPLGRAAPLSALGRALFPPPAGRDVALPAFVVAAATTAMQLFLSGQGELAEQLAARMEAGLARLSPPAPQVAARARFARATRAMVRGEIGLVPEHAQSAIEAYEEAGDVRNAALLRANLGYTYLELGAHERAEEILRAAAGLAERLDLAALAGVARHNLGLALHRRGALDEARDELVACLEHPATAQDQRMEGNARVYLAAVLRDAGALDDALGQAERAVAGLAATPPMRAYALAMLASVRLARGEPALALESARQADELLHSLGAVDEGEALVRLSLVRSLEATGEVVGARTAADDAARRLRERAARIGDAAWQRSFLMRVPENAATLAIAAALGRSA